MKTDQKECIDDFINELSDGWVFRTLVPQQQREGISYAKIRFERYSELLYSVRDRAPHALQRWAGEFRED